MKKRTRTEGGRAAGSPDRSSHRAGPHRRDTTSEGGDSHEGPARSNLPSGGHRPPNDSAPPLTPAPASPDDPAWTGYWTALVEAYESDLRAFARSFLLRRGAGPRAPELAHDAVQAFLATLMAKGWLAQQREIRYPKAFLRKLLTRHMQNTCRRHSARRRGGRLRRVALEEERLTAPEGPATDGDDASAWLAEAINGAIRQLEARKRGQYAAIVRDMIRQAAGGRTSPGLPAHLGFNPRRLPLRKFRARRAFLRELQRAVRQLTPDWKTARARCRWLVRQVLRRPLHIRFS